MGTINEKLDYLETTKTKIKEAIVAKGVAVDDATTFRQYADKITSIPQEGGGGTTQKVQLATNTTFDDSNAAGQYHFDESLDMSKFDTSKTKKLTIKNFTVNGLTNTAVNNFDELNLSDSKFNANDINGNTALKYWIDVNTSNIDENTIFKNGAIGFSSIHPNADGTYNDFVFDFAKFNGRKRMFSFSQYKNYFVGDSPDLPDSDDNFNFGYYSFKFPNSKLTIQKTAETNIYNLGDLYFETGDFSELEFNYTSSNKKNLHISFVSFGNPILNKITNLIPNENVFVNGESNLENCPFETFKMPVDVKVFASNAEDTFFSNKLPSFKGCKNVTTIDLFYEPTEEDYNKLKITNGVEGYYTFHECPKLTTIKFPKIKAEITSSVNRRLFGYSNAFEGKVTVYIDETWRSYIVDQFAKTGVPESQYEIITY